MKGKVALVTGASSEIGQATALAFANKGVKVVIGDINVEGGDEIADVIVWLCSDEASFVTGHTMSIDGGYVAA